MFFGGAAGGGKTDLLLGLSLTAHKRSIVYRRETAQLGAIVERSKEILAGRGWRYNANEHVWRSPDGRTLEFGGAQHEWDWSKHQGHPYDLVCWDELAHFSRLQYRVLNGWNRSSDPKQRCRIVAAGNPPTDPEGRWVVEEFAPWLDSQFPNPAKPGDLKWYAVLDDKLAWLDSGEEIVHKGERIKPRSRTFIPARVGDNPVYANTDYVATLQSLPEPMRSQFLYGDFNAGTEDDPWQCIPTSWVRKAMERWTEQRPAGVEQSCIGVDCARGGKAKTVLSIRHGTWFAPLKKFQGKETPDGPSVATLVIKAHEGDAQINVDVIGIGSSCFDYLKEHDWLTVVAVNNAESKSVARMRDRSGKLKFKNVRAASYWRLREALDPDGKETIALPPDNELLADLCAPHFKVGSQGVVVEPKEEMSIRIGRSPDCGDAVVLCWWDPRRPAGTVRFLRPGLHQGCRLHIVVAGRGDAELELAETPVAVIYVTDPPRPGSESAGLPEHQLGKLVEEIRLSFLDKSPSEYQQRWDEPIPPWNKPITELAMTKEQAKHLWFRLLRKRADGEWIEALLIIDDGGTDRRGMSIAHAVCDTLNLPRTGTIFKASDEAWKAEEGRKLPDAKLVNEFVYATTKQGRLMIVDGRFPFRPGKPQRSWALLGPSSYLRG